MDVIEYRTWSGKIFMSIKRATGCLFSDILKKKIKMLESRSVTLLCYLLINRAELVGQNQSCQEAN